MNQHQFQLQPFQVSGKEPDSTRDLRPLPQLTGLISRQASVLHLQYKLEANLAQLVVPAPVHPAQRRDQLWETTCFELFLGIPGDPCYWELNFSPSGHWNCYAFADYRQRLPVDDANSSDCPLNTESLPMHWLRSADSLGLLLTLDLTPLGLALAPLELSVTAVLEWESGEIEYWAIQHCGNQADFHLRESFSLQLCAPEVLKAI